MLTSHSSWFFPTTWEYDNEQIEPLQGVFFASKSYHEPSFNYFKEEEIFDLASILKPENEEAENQILKDNNLSIIKHIPN